MTAGAGGSGTGSWEYYWGTFQASLGTNQVAVTVDPDQSVAETSYTDNTKSLTFSAAAPQVAGSTMSYTVAQIRDAYGLNNVPSFGSGAADGTGQTIAIDDANNDPSLFSAIDSFDQLYSLTEGSSETVYQQYGAASSFITVYNQNGVNITANIANSGTGTAPNEVPALGDAGSVGEEVGDVAWAHAIAPGARIDLIETDSYGSIITGDGAAASLPDVSVVSNSWALTEWSGETADDSSTYVTPSGHTGVTFLTSSGDNGANAYGADGTTVGTDGYYSAASPNVVSVGGTQLTVNNDAYGGETGWSYPTPSSTIVNGSSSYSQTGSWTSHPGGFSGTYSTAAGGGSGSAVWTVPVTAADTGWGTGVEVSATWTAGAANATNATYTIYDGTVASGTVLGKVTVNQSLAPAGTADGSSQFQELGVFSPTLSANGTGTLTVVLTAASSNGTVVADSVGAAPAWAGTGGPSLFESEPAYQLPVQSTGYRTTPDVSFDASENSLAAGSSGTSLSCPCWAGLIAIVNQGLVAAGGTPLNSPTDPQQTLEALYSLPSSDFNDITSGYNGYSAGAGYDYITGRGTPIASLLIPDLIKYGMAPAVTGVSPSSSSPSGGGTVTLTGTNFTGATRVKFGTVAATSFTVMSNTEITAVVPAHSAGTVDVTVTTPDGTSVDSAADVFMYAAGPTITAVSPASGPAAGGTTVTISGTDLAGVSAVDFGSTAATVLSDTANRIVVLSPTGAPGPVTVKVATSNGIAAGKFTYVAAPTVTGVGPASGPISGGQTVTISGTNLANATAVNFGSAAARIVSDTATQIVVTAPAGAAGGVAVTVATVGGTAGGQYAYVAAPVVTGLSPASGSASGGTTVTITGTNLDNATAVDFGPNAATVISDSATQMVVTSPAGTAGPVSLTVTTVGGTGTGQYTYVAAPVIAGLSPSAGPTAGGETVTITGTDLGNATAVDFGSTAARIVSDTATQIVVAGPAGAAGAVSLTVATAGGTASAQFTYVAEPVVTGISPPTSLTYGGTTVTITGTDLADAAAVDFGGIPGTITSDTDSRIIVTSPAVQAGTVDVTVSTAGGTSATSAADRVTFEPPTPDPTTSTVSLSSAAVQSGGSIEVTLQARDADGNDITTGGLTVALALVNPGGAGGTFGPVTDNGNGTYTATFVATTAGNNTVAATINGVEVTSGSPPVSVTPGPVSPVGSTVSLSSGRVAAGGTVTVRLQAEDVNGNRVAAGGLTVAFALNSSGGGKGTFGPVTYAGQGVYTATFTGTGAGTNTIATKINGQEVTSAAPTLTVTPGAVSRSTSTATLSAHSIASGGSTTITLHAKDAEENPETSGGLAVAFNLKTPTGGQGTFSTVTDNGDGTYTVTFTGTVAGANSIETTVDGQPITSAAPVITVTPGPVSLSESVFSLSATSASAGRTITVTLVAKDAAGNRETAGGLAVAFTLGTTTGGQGKIAAVKDNKNGTYTATFTGTVVGTNVFVAWIGGRAVTSGTPPFGVTPGPVSLAISTVSPSSGSVKTADTIAVTLQATDAYGNPEATGGLKVVFALGSKTGGQGTFGAVTDNKNGTYTVAFTGTAAGGNTITATIGGAKVTSTAPAITVVQGPLSLAKAPLSVSATTMKAGGSVTVTLQPEDAGGDKLIVPDQTVVFGPATGQAFGPTSYNSKTGAYSATCTTTAAGPYQFTATVNGQAVTSPPLRSV